MVHGFFSEYIYIYIERERHCRILLYVCVQPHHVHVVEHPSYDKDDADMFVKNSNAKDVDDDESYETDFSDRKFCLKS